MNKAALKTWKALSVKRDCFSCKYGVVAAKEYYGMFEGVYYPSCIKPLAGMGCREENFGDWALRND